MTRDITSLSEYRERREPEVRDEPIVEPKPGTVGELVVKMHEGQVSREQVIAAIKPLEVIHWDAEVRASEPEDMELGS